ncbi:MAG: hypothetical protein IKW99_09895 [Bacteroidales bacterium]|nr:hypothetical protein [Bacteroidales bacterium]
MKKIILLSICMLTGVWTLSAQQTLYVIDNETVESFDGSQLKGKTIRDYKISTKGHGRNAITVHSITTSPSIYSISKSFALIDSLRLPNVKRFPNYKADTVLFSNGVRIFNSSDKKIVYVIDDKVYKDASAFNSISPDEIASISLIKDGSPEQKKYGDSTAVIKITTKKNADLLDFLKKLPGASVDENGKITVNGQPVKKVTINGSTYSVNTE